MNSINSQKLTYFFVSNIKVTTQYNRFVFVQILEVIPEVFIPTLSVVKPTMQVRVKWKTLDKFNRELISLSGDF